MPKTNSASAGKDRQVGKKAKKRQEVSRSVVRRVPRPGQKCSHCGKGKLDYDGLLQLHCPVCGNVASGGCFT